MYHPIEYNFGKKTVGCSQTSGKKYQALMLAKFQKSVSQIPVSTDKVEGHGLLVTKLKLIAVITFRYESFHRCAQREEGKW